jgi:hypothetical protein
MAIVAPLWTCVPEAWAPDSTKAEPPAEMTSPTVSP